MLAWAHNRTLHGNEKESSTATLSNIGISQSDEFKKQQSSFPGSATPAESPCCWGHFRGLVRPPKTAPFWVTESQLIRNFNCICTVPSLVHFLWWIQVTGLTHTHTKISERRHRGQESKVRTYEATARSQCDSGQTHVSSCAEFLWQAAHVGCRSEGAEYSLGREGFGVVFPDFLPSSTFPRGGGIFSLFSLDHECHGFGARWVFLIWEANFIVIRV